MSFYTGSLFLTTLVSLALGMFVYLKGRDRLANITLAAFSVSMALWTLGQGMGEVVAGKEMVLFWTREGIAAAIFIPVFFLHFTLALVGGEKKESVLIRMVYALGFLLLALDFTPYFVADVAPAFGFRYYPVAGPVYLLFGLFLFAAFIYSFLRLCSAYFPAEGAKRNQLLYVILATVVGFLGGTTTFFPLLGVNFPVLSHFALPFYLAVTIYSIVKHRLLDISVIVREGLIYSALTILFAGFYVLAILVASFFLQQFGQLNLFITMLLVVFVSVLVFEPLRDKVQKLVDRFFFQGEYRYQKTIDDLSAENRKLFRNLLQADKLAALGTLSAGLAHEIKNPLASIKGMTQVLDENLQDPVFIRKYQDIVTRQIDRINGLVEKLLKVGQPQELILARVNLKQVIEDVLALVENQCRKANVLIERNVLPLPMMTGDAGQLAQVFTNLFLNAIHAMPQGGTLIVSARGGDGINIEVRDTGDGIPEDKLNAIFDPFFTTKETGTGLGLAVVYRIIKEHGGTIQVDSQPEKGTQFTLWFPIRPKV